MPRVFIDFVDVVSDVSACFQDIYHVDFGGKKSKDYDQHWKYIVDKKSEFFMKLQPRKGIFEFLLLCQRAQVKVYIFSRVRDVETEGGYIKVWLKSHGFAKDCLASLKILTRLIIFNDRDYESMLTFIKKPHRTDIDFCYIVCPGVVSQRIIDCQPIDGLKDRKRKQERSDSYNVLFENCYIAPFETFEKVESTFVELKKRFKDDIKAKLTPTAAADSIIQSNQGDVKRGGGSSSAAEGEAAVAPQLTSSSSSSSSSSVGDRRAGMTSSERIDPSAEPDISEGAVESMQQYVSAVNVINYSTFTNDDYETICCLTSLIKEYKSGDTNPLSFKSTVQRIYTDMHVENPSASKAAKLQSTIDDLFNAESINRQLRAALLYASQKLKWADDRIHGVLVRIHEIEGVGQRGYGGFLKIFSEKEKKFKIIRPSPTLDSPNKKYIHDDPIDYITSLSTADCALDAIAMEVCFSYYHMFLDYLSQQMDRNQSIMPVMLTYDSITKYFNEDLERERTFISSPNKPNRLPSQNPYNRLIQNQLHLDSLQFANLWLQNVVLLTNDAKENKTIDYADHRRTMSELLDRVIGIKQTTCFSYRKISSEFEDRADSQSNTHGKLELAGISLLYTKDSYDKDTSTAFKMLCLHKLIPMFRIYQGLCSIIDSLFTNMFRKNPLKPKPLNNSPELETTTRKKDIVFLINLCEFMLDHSSGFIMNYRGFLWYTLLKLKLKATSECANGGYRPVEYVYKWRDDLGGYLSADYVIRLEALSTKIMNKDALIVAGDMESSQQDLQSLNLRFKNVEASVNTHHTAKKNRVLFSCSANGLTEFANIVVVSRDNLYDATSVSYIPEDSLRKSDLQCMNEGDSLVDPAVQSKLENLVVEELAILKYFHEIKNAFPDLGSFVILQNYKGGASFQAAIMLSSRLQGCDNNLTIEISKKRPSSAAHGGNLFASDEFLGGGGGRSNGNCVRGCMAWLGLWRENQIWGEIKMAFMRDEIMFESNRLLYPRSFLNNPYDIKFFQEYYCYPFHNLSSCQPTHQRCSGFFDIRKEAFDKKIEKISKMSSHEIYFTVMRHHHKFQKDEKASEIACLCVAIGGKRLSKLLIEILKLMEIYYRGAPDLVLFKIEATELESMHSCYVTNLDNEAREMDLGARSNNQFRCSCQPVKVKVDVGAGGSGSPRSSDKSSANRYHTESVITAEVKSAKDHLSEWQMLWLQLLSDCGIPSEVFKLQDKK